MSGPVRSKTSGASSQVGRFFVAKISGEVSMKPLRALFVCLLSLGFPGFLMAQEGLGTITTVPGIGYAQPGGNRFTWEDGSGGMTVDGRGNLYVCSEGMVYCKSPDGTTKRVIGRDYREFGTYSYMEVVFLRSIAEGISATESLVFSTNAGDSRITRFLSLSSGMAVDLKGSLYVASGDRQRIRRADVDGTIWTATGGGDTVRAGPTISGQTGLRELVIQAGFSGDGGPAKKALLNKPTDVALDGQGYIYIADYGNNRIRIVSREGFIWTFAGTGAKPMTAGEIGDGGAAILAVLDTPVSVAVDLKGNVYVAELYGHRVRRIAPDGPHTITTFAGTGEPGFSGDGGPATRAQLNNPMGLAVDVEGNVYIADYQNHRVRRVGKDGVITTFAGSGQSGAEVSGDGGPATQARLDYPRDVAVDSKGYVYITSMESETHGVVRRVSPAKSFEIPLIRLSATSLSFEATSINTTLEQTLTISNPAKETPLLVELMVEDNPPEFKLIPTDFLIPPGGSQKVAVRFTPSSLRPTLATLRVYHSGVEENPLRVSLSFGGAIKSADFDGNGRVDFDDFFLFAMAFGREGVGENARYDLDGNYRINFDDFFLFAAKFGK